MHTHSKQLFLLTLVLIFSTLVFVPLLAHAQASGSLSAASLAVAANVDRASFGLMRVQENAVLNTAAQHRADDMATRGYFAHTSPQGISPCFWVTSAGYVYSSVAENISAGHETTEAVERAWMNSQGHRKNILNAKYTDVGFGIARGMYRGRMTTFVVEILAAPKK
jgi:uncharacterized protein YkwD